MIRKQNALTMNLAYYARFLRTGKVEDAVMALRDPEDKEQGYSQYSPEEQKKAVEICKSCTKGKIALMRWRHEQTVNTANLAFVILFREGETIPDDLLQFVTNNVEKQIMNYENNHPFDNGFDEWAEHYSKLKKLLRDRNDNTTKVEVFKNYAEKHGIPGTETKDGWEVVKERFKKSKQREIKKLKKRKEHPFIRKRVKEEIEKRIDILNV